MNVKPFQIIDGCPTTFRKLLKHSLHHIVIDILHKEFHKDQTVEDTENSYKPVIDVLLAKPPTPPTYPILLSYFVPGDVEKKHGIDYEPYISVHLLNPNYQEPPKDLKPHYSHDHSVPKGSYNAHNDCFQPTFGVSGSNWSDLIDSSVWVEDDNVFKLVTTIEHAVAHILWEITFFGYTEEKIQSIWNGIKKDMDLYFEEGKEKNE